MHVNCSVTCSWPIPVIILMSRPADFFCALFLFISILFVCFCYPKCTVPHAEALFSTTVSFSHVSFLPLFELINKCLSSTLYILGKRTCEVKRIAQTLDVKICIYQEEACAKVKMYYTEGCKWTVNLFDLLCADTVF